MDNLYLKECYRIVVKNYCDNKAKLQTSPSWGIDDAVIEGIIAYAFDRTNGNLIEINLKEFVKSPHIYNLLLPIVFAPVEYNKLNITNKVDGE